MIELWSVLILCIIICIIEACVIFSLKQAVSQQKEYCKMLSCVIIKLKKER